MFNNDYISIPGYTAPVAPMSRVAKSLLAALTVIMVAQAAAGFWLMWTM